MQNTITKGYKVTNSKMQCLEFQFELNKTFKQPGELQICNNGFHFCQKVSHCFNYYSFTSENKVFEVEAYGEIETKDDKSCCLEIKLIRELEWSEVLKIANQGLDNTGHSNTGYWNTGYWNTGDRNTGYSNTGNRNTGLFCTGDAPFPLFNKASSWTEKDFENSRAYRLLLDVNTKVWIYPYQMNEEEKTANPSYKTCDGYLKNIPFKEAFQNCWHNWDKQSHEAFTSLPNFDAKIFEEITGVQVCDATKAQTK